MEEELEKQCNDSDLALILAPNASHSSLHAAASLSAGLLAWNSLHQPCLHITCSSRMVSPFPSLSSYPRSPLALDTKLGRIGFLDVSTLIFCVLCTQLPYPPPISRQGTTILLSLISRWHLRDTPTQHPIHSVSHW